MPCLSECDEGWPVIPSRVRANLASTGGTEVPTASGAPTYCRTPVRFLVWTVQCSYPESIGSRFVKKERHESRL